jgi:hypothetical protein
VLDFLLIFDIMKKMKVKWICLILFVLFWLGMIASPSHAKGRGMPPQLSAYDGKTFTGVQDPEYLPYDLALRAYLVKRISKRCGITLDPKTYSGFDLLEIESLFRCKKSDEPFDMFLKKFPKAPSD